jgi:SRSO17 transposase
MTPSLGRQDLNPCFPQSEFAKTLRTGPKDLNMRISLALVARPFLERLGHKTRRRMCPVYISGLIGPGDRKSIQPMAERLALGAYDQLHHFVSAGVWDVAPVETERLVQADKLVGGRDAVLVIDDTAVLKKPPTAGLERRPRFCSHNVA